MQNWLTKSTSGDWLVKKETRNKHCIIIVLELQIDLVYCIGVQDNSGPQKIVSN